ncbi:hypothetical protein M0812_02458 [Anaeramoeba flamelloides]|uniref:Uncharacterized protein n=1 Tax=Anaeramoeba flamelloides TaxID=1746091 RepID=A0AAV7YM20_9EUKA|nr:hypothetical protein M0812_02458 [Anaeramoeba flamelloides]
MENINFNILIKHEFVLIPKLFEYENKSLELGIRNVNATKGPTVIALKSVEMNRYYIGVLEGKPFTIREAEDLYFKVDNKDEGFIKYGSDVDCYHLKVRNDFLILTNKKFTYKELLLLEKEEQNNKMKLIQQKQENDLQKKQLDVQKKKMGLSKIRFQLEQLSEEIRLRNEIIQQQNKKSHQQVDTFQSRFKQNILKVRELKKDLGAILKETDQLHIQKRQSQKNKVNRDKHVTLVQKLEKLRLQLDREHKNTQLTEEEFTKVLQEQNDSIRLIKENTRNLNNSIPKLRKEIENQN